MTLSIQVDPESARLVAELVGGVAARVADLTPINQEALLMVQADVDQRFASAPRVRSTAMVWGGETWPSLSNMYLEDNPRREGGQQLRDTGELLQSFQVGQRANVTQSDASGWTFGSALPKASELHQDRPLIFFHPQLSDNLVLLYAAFLLGEYS